jgi:hypothetical protein
LLEHFVDVRCVRFGALLGLFLVAGGFLRGFRRLLRRSLGHG